MRAKEFGVSCTGVAGEVTAAAGAEVPDAEAVAVLELAAVIETLASEADLLSIAQQLNNKKMFIDLTHVWDTT